MLRAPQIPPPKPRLPHRTPGPPNRRIPHHHRHARPNRTLHAHPRRARAGRTPDPLGRPARQPLRGVPARIDVRHRPREVLRGHAVGHERDADARDPARQRAEQDGFGEGGRVEEGDENEIGDAEGRANGGTTGRGGERSSNNSSGDPSRAKNVLGGGSFRRLNRTVAKLIDDFGMVSFLQLDARDEDSVGAILSYVDDAIQYHEAQEPREPIDETDYGDMEMG